MGTKLLICYLAMHASPLQYSIAQQGIREQVGRSSCGVCVLQFLPQDRVQSFAQMTPKQLLEESERALADGKYYDIHQDLVKDSQLLENSQHVSPFLAEHPAIPAISPSNPYTTVMPMGYSALDHNHC